MLGAIKLPSSGVSQNKFPYVEVIWPNYLEVCGAVELKRGRNQLSKSVQLIKHYDMVQESSTCGLKTASTVTENLNTLNEHHLLIFCKRVTIIASG